MEKKGYLLLENGRLFEGVLRGAQHAAMGEAVFTTSVIGYMENLTDPCYAGQIVVQTFPCVGNYGVVPMAEGTADPVLAALVCREICEEPSNFRCEGKLDDYMKAKNVTCLTGVDTRAITRALRDEGVMKAAILTEKPEDIEAAVAQLKAAPAEGVSKGVQAVEPARQKGMYNVALWDFGASLAIRTELEDRGCAVTMVPAGATVEEILALNPDGVVLSCGGGHPAEYADAVAQLTELCEKRIPTFGIGLGHQLLALSQGAEIIKLQAGHRGGNQPIRDLRTGLNYITTQNHGYAVDGERLPENAALRFINCNDGTCEGVDYADMPAFSVQFMPEKCGGPMDSRFLFERFIALMGGNKECR